MPDVAILTLAQVSDSDLLKALSLKSAPCYAAMAFANALGGTPSIPWMICHSTKLADIISEVRLRKLDISSLKCAVEDLPVEKCLYFRRAEGTITEEEFLREFAKWQRGEKNV